MNTGNSTHTSMTLNLLNFSTAVTINLTTMNVHCSNIHSTIESRPELFIELDCQQNTRSNHNDRLRGGGSSETTLHVLDHHKGLTTTGRDGDTTHSSSQQSIESALLMWAKGQGQRLSCADEYSIWYGVWNVKGSVPVINRPPHQLTQCRTLALRALHQ